MKVGIVCAGYPERIGGVTEVVRELTKNLKKIGVDVKIITSGRPSRDENGRIIVCKRVLTFPFWSFLKFPQIFRKYKFDILHFQANNGVGIVIWRFFLRNKFPKSITTLHTSLVSERKRIEPVKINNDFIVFPSLSDFVFKYLKAPIGIIMDIFTAKFSDSVACVCKNTMNECVCHYYVGKKKVKVIYNGVDLNKFSLSVNEMELRHRCLLKDEYIVLFVGRLALRKNIFGLIDVFKKVLQEIPNSKLLVVGGFKNLKYAKIINTFINDLNIQDKVKFLGSLNPNQVQSYYRVADVFVLPSTYEGFPLVILEAMASQKPVVAFDVGGNSEAIIEGQTGYLAEKGDHETMASKIVLLLKNLDLRKRIGENGRKMVEEKFNWEAIANEYFEEYKKLLERNQKP